MSAGTTTTNSLRTARVRLSDYVALTKPRIVTMVLVTTCVAALKVPGETLHFWLLLHTLIGTFCTAASASVFNHVLERESDGRMPRTMKRPLPAHRVNLLPASLFGLALLLVGAFELFEFVNATAGAMGLLTWAGYVVLYTPLKRLTTWNTTVGAVGGAMPIWIGWTANGGDFAQPLGWILFLGLFFWQYPHFMAIAWKLRNQYRDAGIRMVTVSDPTGRTAGLEAIGGSLAMIALGGALWFVEGPVAWKVAAIVCVTLLNLWLLAASIRFARNREDGIAMRLMRTSLLHLPAWLAVTAICSGV
ncbi:MAG TPA: heme o synthase [Pirellulaceae bacterium]|nr:heme o synthase [Pirellulaceae bacterium]